MDFGLSAPVIHLISETIRGRENCFLSISSMGTVQNDAFRCCCRLPLSFEKSQRYVIVRKSVLIQHCTHTPVHMASVADTNSDTFFFPPVRFNQLEAFKGEKNSTRPHLICLTLWQCYVSNTTTKHTMRDRKRRTHQSALMKQN